MKSVVGAGDGMMKALGSQIETGIVSESNKNVMEEVKKGSDAKVSIMHDIHVFHFHPFQCIMVLNTNDESIQSFLCSP